jgi:glycosyltransferase involved in cell wall biosynthesis
MKKVLILAYDFPPYVSVGGLRPYNWYRYFKEFGIEPVVITRQWNNHHGNELDYISPGFSIKAIIETDALGTIIRTPYIANLSNRLLLQHGEKRFRLLRKIISGYYEIAQFLFWSGPKIELYKEARQYLKKNKVDVIIATGDPFILFRYASKLSSDFNIPWIADYRDCWVQDKTRSRNILLRSWNAYFERRYLKNVEKVITVSTFLQQQIEQNIRNKPFEILLNGFNPDAVREANLVKQSSNEMTIAFAGTIYKWHPIEGFINALDKFLEDNKGIRLSLKLYGINRPEKIKELINNTRHLASAVYIFPKMDNEGLMKVLSDANIFLLFNDYSILGTKIFPYLGLKRKIILCFSEDYQSKKLKDRYFHLKEIPSESNALQAELIRNTNSGIIVRDQAHLLNVLEDLWKEFSETGQIVCDSHGVEKYSRKVQVERLAELLASVHQPRLTLG